MGMLMHSNNCASPAHAVKRRCGRFKQGKEEGRGEEAGGVNAGSDDAKWVGFDSSSVKSLVRSVAMRRTEGLGAVEHCSKPRLKHLLSDLDELHARV